MDAPLNHKSPSFEEIISQEAIEEAVLELADCLNEEYSGGPPLILIAVLKGAFCFLADLMRRLNIDTEITFIQASSYGNLGTQRGALTIQEIMPLDITGKDVLILDDIFDSGSTLEAIASYLRKKKPATLKTAVLLTKKIVRNTPFRPNYSLFEVEDDFVVGYGLDYKEHYRHLPAIYKLEEV